VSAGGRGSRLDRADHVVAHVPDRAAVKRGNPGPRRPARRPELAARGARGVARLPRGGPPGRLRPALDPVPAVAPHLPRLRSQKCVAGQRSPPTSDSSRNANGGRATFASAATGVSASRHHLAHEAAPSRPAGLARNSVRWSATRFRGNASPAARGVCRSRHDAPVLPAPAPRRRGTRIRRWRSCARRGDAGRSVASGTALRDYKAQAHDSSFFSDSSAEGLTRRAPRKSRPVGVGSVLESPGAEQATHRRLARPAELPTDIASIATTRHCPEQFRRRHPPGRWGRKCDVPHPLAPSVPPVRLCARRFDDHYAAAAGLRVVRSTCARGGDQPGIRRHAVISMPRPLTWCVSRSGFTARAYLDPQLEDRQHSARNGCGTGASGSPTGRSSRFRRRATCSISRRAHHRGRWDVDGYPVQPRAGQSWFAGEGDQPLPKAERTRFPGAVARCAFRGS